MLLARLRAIDGTYPQQANVTSIILNVYDRENDMTRVYGPISVSIGSLFNTIQPYDGILWAVDRIGYNFKYRIAGALAFPQARDYRVVFMFIMSDGGLIPLEYDTGVKPLP